MIICTCIFGLQARAGPLPRMQHTEARLHRVRRAPSQAAAMPTYRREPKTADCSRYVPSLERTRRIRVIEELLFQLGQVNARAGNERAWRRRLNEGVGGSMFFTTPQGPLRSTGARHATSPGPFWAEAKEITVFQVSVGCGGAGRSGQPPWAPRASGP